MSSPNLALFIVVAIAPSFIIACVATLVMRRVAPRFGLVDRPNHRKVHRTPTPLGGGIAIAIAVILPFAVGSIGLLLLSDVAFDEIVPAFAKGHRAGLVSRLGGLWTVLGGASILTAVPSQAW